MGLAREVLFYGSSVAAAGALVVAAWSQGNKPTQHIESVGKDTVKYATLYPGKYCDVRVGTQVDKTATVMSWIPSVPVAPGLPGIPLKLGPVHAPHETLTGFMSGLMQSDGCFVVRKSRKVEVIGHTATLDLPISGDPATTGFEVITYPENYETMKFWTDGGNWVKRLDDATLAGLNEQVDKELDVLPFMHLGDGATPAQTLMKTDLLVGSHYVAIECGEAMAKAVTASHNPGQNAATQMIYDLNLTHGVKVTSIKVNLTPDPKHPGVADQYSTSYEKDISNIPGLKESHPAVPDCTTLVRSLGHASS